MSFESGPIQRAAGSAENKPEKDPHQEAVQFVARHRDFLDHYVGGTVAVEPAPAGLDTFAFNLKKNKIYVNSRFYESRGFSDQKTLFATLHELEHFQEKARLLAEVRGQSVFASYLKKIEQSKAFGLLDNCVADIRGNRTVVAKTSADFGELEKTMYQEDLMTNADFTSEPKHVQFAMALLREARVPDEACAVAPEVRERLDKIRDIVSAQGSRLMDIMTHPNLPMSSRLKLQERHIVPLMRELLDMDLQEKQQGQGQLAESQPGVEGENAGSEKLDPNEAFADAYERAAEKIPHAVPFEKEKEAFNEWQKSGGPRAAADAEYARSLGVSPEALREYRDLVKNIENIKNPETDERVVEELRQLFERIIARRLKPTAAPRYPMEEGEDLVDPAGLVAGVKAGNLEPKAWETTETKERRGPQFGEVEITLVCDRSGSMEGAKLVEQRRAAVMMMEALREFAERCGEERVNMDAPLEVRSEVFSFQADSNDAKPLKAMSAGLGEGQRVKVAASLGSAPGKNTTDYVPLEAISARLSDDEKNKITEGTLKKIVIVFTDGDSGDAGRVGEALKKLRGAGVVAVGVGITDEGASVLTTYAPEAQVVSDASRLAPALAGLLKDHLADV